MHHLRHALVVTLLLTGAAPLSCGGDSRFGQRCFQNAECGKTEVCQARPLSQLPESYCTHSCEPEGAGCPGDYECLAFSGTDKKPLCIKQADVAAFK